MKLYHISKFADTEPCVKLFFPRIPNSTGPDENKNIPRICLSTDIKLCLQAIPHAYLDENNIYTLYTVDIDCNDTALIYPEYLFKHSLVPDALENNEYWYTKPLLMRGCNIRITELSESPDFAWSCIPESELERIILRLQPDYEQYFHLFNNSQDMYDFFVDLAFKEKNYVFVDEIDELIFDEIPWSSIYKISHLKYKKLQKVS